MLLGTVIVSCRKSCTSHLELTLHQDVSHKEDRDRSVVLHTFKVEIFLEAVQTCLWQRVAVKIVQEVHRPKNWLQESARALHLVTSHPTHHQSTINLAHQLDLSWIGLFP